MASRSEMLRHGTPVEDHLARFGLLVKREDLSCRLPGPPFSKTRGVFAHIAARPEGVIGVLDTYHSQAGHAVAAACRELGKQCVNFWPLRKANVSGSLSPQQRAARELGAEVRAIQAGRSSVLYHQAKKLLPEGAYMMPNALKLPEMVTETAAEVGATLASTRIPPGMPVLIAASSGTIAAGVMRGFWEAGQHIGREFIIHQGYDRSADAMYKYMEGMADLDLIDEVQSYLVEEGYSYGDVARPGPDPLWPCNQFYDLKAFRWWMREGRSQHGEALLWNIG